MDPCRAVPVNGRLTTRSASACSAGAGGGLANHASCQQQTLPFITLVVTRSTRYRQCFTPGETEAQEGAAERGLLSPTAHSWACALTFLKVSPRRPR